LICEGWLPHDPCPSRTCPLGPGAPAAAGAHSRLAGPRSDDLVFSVLRGAPATPRATIWCRPGSVQHRSLPEEAGELPRAGDRHLAARLLATLAQVNPAGVEARLGAPGDLADPRILALLAAAQLNPDPWTGPVVVGGLDQEAAGMARPGLGDRALAA